MRQLRRNDNSEARLNGSLARVLNSIHTGIITSHYETFFSEPEATVDYSVPANRAEQAELHPPSMLTKSRQAHGVQKSVIQEYH